MNYLLLGLGKANSSVQKYFNKNHITYFVYDDFKCQSNIDFTRISKIIKSPGINPNHHILKQHDNVITDLDLFYQFSNHKEFITVTGSNGKTTTVNLLKHLLPELDLGGNIGYPLFDFVSSENDIIIEASSFMLEYIDTFRSKYSVILNLYKTHIEHHGSYKNYLKSKLNLIRNARIDDYLIYNYDDVLLRRLVVSFPGILVPFSRRSRIGVHLQGNNIVYNGKIIYNINKIKLQGNHNIDNILAAIATVISYGRKVNCFDDFSPIEYRIQYVGKIKNIDIYNDSKSTNYLALNSAIQTFKNKKILLVSGGKFHQDNSFSFDSFSSIERVYLYGENSNEMTNIFKEDNIEFYIYHDLEEVMKNLNLIDVDVILFSPGSVSYDQFNSFEERGKYFNKLVELYLKNIP